MRKYLGYLNIMDLHIKGNSIMELTMGREGYHKLMIRVYIKDNSKMASRMATGNINGKMGTNIEAISLMAREKDSGNIIMLKIKVQPAEHGKIVNCKEMANTSKEMDRK